MRERELEVEIARLNAQIAVLQGETEPTEIAARFLNMAATTVDKAMADARREADELAHEVTAEAEARRDEATRLAHEANREAEEAKARAEALHIEARDQEAAVLAARHEAERVTEAATQHINKERARVADEVERLAEVRSSLESERTSLESYHHELKRRVQELAESMVSFMTTEPPLAAVAAIDEVAKPAIAPAAAAVDAAYATPAPAQPIDADAEAVEAPLAEVVEMIPPTASVDEPVAAVVEMAPTQESVAEFEQTVEYDDSPIDAEQAAYEQAAYDEQRAAYEAQQAAYEQAARDEQRAAYEAQQAAYEQAARDEQRAAYEAQQAAYEAQQAAYEQAARDEEQAAYEQQAAYDEQPSAEPVAFDDRVADEDAPVYDAEPIADVADAVAAVLEGPATTEPDAMFPSELAAQPNPAESSFADELAEVMAEEPAPRTSMIDADEMVASIFNRSEPAAAPAPANDADHLDLFGRATTSEAEPVGRADVFDRAARRPGPSFTDMMSGPPRTETPAEEFGGVPVAESVDEARSRRKKGGIFARVRNNDNQEPVEPVLPEAPTPEGGLFSAEASRMIEQTSPDQLASALSGRNDEDERFRSFLDGDGDDGSRDWLLRPEQDD